MSINRVNISGHLTRDPELRTTQSGMDVLKVGVAVNERRKNQSTGEWEDVPNFVDCTVFGNRARSLSQYLSKGDKVAIEGKLHWSQWERDGQKRSKLDVIVDDLEFMSRKSDSGAAYASQGQNAYTYNPQQAYASQAAPQQAYAPSQPPSQTQQGAYSPAYGAPAPVVQPAAVTPSLYDDDIPF